MFDWLDGYKTQLGGIIKILSGVAAILGIIAGVITHLIDPNTGVAINETTIAAFLAGVYMVGQGFSTIGLGHKLEKARDAQIATATATQEIAQSNEKIANKV